MRFLSRLFGNRQKENYSKLSQAVFTHRIPSKSILQLSMHDVDKVADQVEQQIRRQGNFQPWDITVDGYDLDHRALFEIPEVRAWSKQALQERIYLPIIVTSDTLRWLLLSLVEFEVLDRSDEHQDTFEHNLLDRFADALSKNDPNLEQVARLMQQKVRIRVNSIPEQSMEVYEIMGCALLDFHRQFCLSEQEKERLAKEVALRIADACTWLLSPSELRQIFSKDEKDD